MFESCVSIIKKGDEILLIKKLRGLGQGLYNFPGGKKEENESIEHCAIRETEEEVGLKIKSLEKVGEIWFYVNSRLEEIMHVFLVNQYEGEPKSSEEAIPIWYKIASIPYTNMWEDDKIWLPKVLKGEKIRCNFYFGENWKGFLGGTCSPEEY
ncbi:MAG: 8-oxo-dGTP diphosphatase [Sulfolobaceae archaeon]|nr:8-oxo-dGTP diphosphatase [Sulfolobaceae archaeon]